MKRILLTISLLGLLSGCGEWDEGVIDITHLPEIQAYCDSMGVEGATAYIYQSRYAYCKWISPTGNTSELEVPSSALQPYRIKPK